MVTINKKLEKLTLSDVNDISNEYLKGYRLLEKRYGFRLRGLNKKRIQFGLLPISEIESVEYRVNYILDNYSQDEIELELTAFLLKYRIDQKRWEGFELFNCFFHK